MRKESTYLKFALWHRKKTCGLLAAMALSLSMAAGCAKTENEGIKTEDAGAHPDKDEANMHIGTYGCDVENADLGFTEGGGIYLVLFPEVIYANSEASTTGSPKYDYGISIEQQEDGSYQMINVSTFNIYTLKKQ